MERCDVSKPSKKDVVVAGEVVVDPRSLDPEESYAKRFVPRPASGIPAGGLGAGPNTNPVPFTSETAKAAGEKSREIQRMRKQVFREGYNAAMSDAGATIARMQWEEILRVSKLPPGHAERLKLLANLGEKTLDRLMGKASVSVEHDGEVGIAHKIAKLAEAE